MKTLNKNRILVVDDDQSICESMVAFLEDADFSVSLAASAEAALEILMAETFELAIVDLRLPGMNGDMFIKHANKMKPEMRFLIYTGSADYKPSQELIRIGIGPKYLFAKPLNDLGLMVKEIESLMTDL